MLGTKFTFACSLLVLMALSVYASPPSVSFDKATSSVRSSLTVLSPVATTETSYDSFIIGAPRIGHTHQGDIDVKSERSHAYTGVSGDSPRVLTPSDTAHSFYEQITDLDQGAAVVNVTETYGAFNSLNKGIALFVKASAYNGYPYISNTFSIPDGAEIPVFTVNETVISEDPIGVFKAGGMNRLYFTPADGVAFADLIEEIDALYTFKDVWAVPIFDSGLLLPTVVDASVEVVSGASSDSSLTISNGPATYSFASYTHDTIIGGESFNMTFEWTSTHFDDLQVRLDFADVPATIDTCVDIQGNVLAVSTTNKIATASLVTVFAETTDDLVANMFNCTFTAFSSEDAGETGATTATLSVYRSGETEPDVSKDMTIPAIKGSPVATTKLSVRIARDTLLPGKTVTAIFKAATTVFKGVDDTFTSDRFLAINQEIVTAPLTMATADPEPTYPYLRLSAHVTGVSVAEVDSLATDIGSSISDMGYSVTVSPAESSEISDECETGCGGECGKCIDGHACETSDDCFSACEDGVCKTNSARAASVFAMTVVVAVALMSLV